METSSCQTPASWDPVDSIETGKRKLQLSTPTSCCNLLSANIVKLKVSFGFDLLRQIMTLPFRDYQLKLIFNILSGLTPSVQGISMRLPTGEWHLTAKLCFCPQILFLAINFIFKHIEGETNEWEVGSNLNCFHMHTLLCITKGLYDI